MKSKKKIIIAVAIVILAIIGVAVWGKCCGKDEDKKNKANTNNITKTTGSDTVQSETEGGVTNITEGQDIEDISVNVVEADDLEKPGKNTLDISKIQGFVPKKSNETKDNSTVKADEDNKNDSKKDDSENNNTKEADAEGSSNNGNQLNYRLSDGNLVIESVGGYTGNYLEDGSDEPIQNVAALVVTNNSDSMLQVGDIAFQVNKSEIAVFRITNLLPGTSVLVLEANKREYKDEDDYSYGNVTTAYLPEPTLSEEQFKITKADGKLVLENKTNDTYKQIYVYYKYAQTGGAYLGGITYRVPFNNVKGYSKVESVANHFNKSTSVIVDIKVTEK